MCCLMSDSDSMWLQEGGDTICLITMETKYFAVIDT